MSDCLQLDHRYRTTTQKRSKFPRLGRADGAASAQPTADAMPILKKETLSRAKKANQRCDAEFDMSKRGGQL
jgi:hypothetical protein